MWIPRRLWDYCYTLAVLASKDILCSLIHALSCKCRLLRKIQPTSQRHSGLSRMQMLHVPRRIPCMILLVVPHCLPVLASCFPLVWEPTEGRGCVLCHYMGLAYPHAWLPEALTERLLDRAVLSPSFRDPLVSSPKEVWGPDFRIPHTLLLSIEYN